MRMKIRIAEKKWILYLFTVFFVLILFPQSAKAETVNVSIEVQYGQTEARAMIDLINKFRTGSDAWYWSEDNSSKVTCSGLQPLIYDEKLEKAAMKRAAELALSYSHTRPDGHSCSSVTDEFDIGWMAYGENIAAGYNSAENVFIGWREDEDFYAGQGHRRNMLSDKFTYIGIGHVFYNNCHYWVQEFATEGSSALNSANDSLTEVEIAVDTSNINGVGIVYVSGSQSVKEGETADIPVCIPLIEVYGGWPSGTKCRLVYPVKFTSADEKYISLANGKMTGLKAGTGSIYCDVFGRECSLAIDVTAAPTEVPTAAPTNTPVPVVTEVPTTVPTAAPTNTPVPVVTEAPTTVPTAAPTNTPVPVVTEVPTTVPTAAPTNTPVPVVTEVPTTVPTAAPTNTPVPVVTEVPTTVPTAAPTNTPVPVVTEVPTTVPTAAPTNTPVPVVTEVPTTVPTAAPTNTPVPVVTEVPTTAPTAAPTNTPVPEKELKKEEQKGYTFTSGNGTYEVTADGSGKVAYVGPDNATAKKVKIPATVKINGISYKVTKIDDGAFSGNKYIKTVTIGSNVTEIGKNAFKGCTSLTKITLPKKVTKIAAKAFYGCKKLTAVTISASKLKSIGSKAFYNMNAKAVITLNVGNAKAAEKMIKNSKIGKKVTVKPASN